jgi:hypothetical protein
MATPHVQLAALVTTANIVMRAEELVEFAQEAIIRHMSTSPITMVEIPHTKILLGMLLPVQKRK